MTEYNQHKVLNAFIENRVSETQRWPILVTYEMRYPYVKIQKQHEILLGAGDLQPGGPGGLGR